MPAEEPELKPKTVQRETREPVEEKIKGSEPLENHNPEPFESEPQGRRSVEVKETKKQQERVVQEEVLFSWIAPSRPFKKRSREFWIRVISITTVASLILFIVEGTVPVLLAIAIAFLFFVMSTVKPDDMEYKITNFGVYVAGQITGWEVFTRFWFGDRLGKSLLIFEKLDFPGRMEMMVHAKDKDKIREVLRDYVLDEEVPQSNFDRSADWLSKKVSGSDMPS